MVKFLFIFYSVINDFNMTLVLGFWRIGWRYIFAFGRVLNVVRCYGFFQGSLRRYKLVIFLQGTTKS